MEVLAGLSVVILVLTAAGVAIKTFALWRRSRELPELLLAGMLVGATVTGYPLAVACNQIPATQMPAIHVAYPIAINLGFMFLLLFTLRVFRATSRLALGLVVVCMLMLAGSAVAYILDALGENPSQQGEMVGLSLVNSTPIAIAYFWTTFESLAYYRRLQLQRRLGLGRSGLVANRLLLWGMMGAAAGIAVVMNAAAMLAGSFMSPAMVSISSLLGLVHAGCLFLAFHPPAWYRGWVEARWSAAPAS